MQLNQTVSPQVAIQQLPLITRWNQAQYNNQGLVKGRIMTVGVPSALRKHRIYCYLLPGITGGQDYVLFARVIGLIQSSPAFELPANIANLTNNTMQLGNTVWSAFVTGGNAALNSAAVQLPINAINFPSVVAQPQEIVAENIDQIALEVTGWAGGITNLWAAIAVLSLGQ